MVICYCCSALLRAFLKIMIHNIPFATCRNKQSVVTDPKMFKLRNLPCHKWHGHLSENPPQKKTLVLIEF